jgi:hypothetical protein
MERCSSFRPWHDKTSGRTSLKTRQARCLHDYFYFIDQDLGLCYLRVPTWAPFRLQFYFNGHNWLSRRLEKRGITFTLLDNAFILARNSGQVSRLLKRLRVHGLIKRIGRTYKYYLTRLGRSVVACALRLREEAVVPALAIANG